MCRKFYFYTTFKTLKIFFLNKYLCELLNFSKLKATKFWIPYFLKTKNKLEHNLYNVIIFNLILKIIRYRFFLILGVLWYLYPLFFRQLLVITFLGFVSFPPKIFCSIDRSRSKSSMGKHSRLLHPLEPDPI